MEKTNNWVVRLECIDGDGSVIEASVIGQIVREIGSSDISGLGLGLAEGKEILESLQREIVQRQVNAISRANRTCGCCGLRRPLHDYLTKSVRTLFGKVYARFPRFRRCRCKSEHLDTFTLSRSTPEFEHVVAELGARHSFREAAQILNLFLPTSSVINHTAVRSTLAEVADRIEERQTKMPYRMSRSTKGPVSVFIDGSYVRAIPGYSTRHFEVVMGKVETDTGRSFQFASMPNVDTPKSQTILSGLKAQGWLPGRDIVVFSDGDPNLADAVRQASRSGVTHILDWFHIAMRIQHIRQTCQSLVKVDEDDQLEFRFAARELDQMRSNLWCGKVMTAQWLLCAAAGELRMVDRRRHPQRTVAKINRLAKMIIEFDRYLEINEASIPDYADRYRRGLSVSSSRAESSSNSLVNRRMNKRQQMRWSPKGAHRVLQARVAVLDGRLSNGNFKVAA